MMRFMHEGWCVEVTRRRGETTQISVYPPGAIGRLRFDCPKGMSNKRKKIMPLVRKHIALAVLRGV